MRVHALGCLLSVLLGILAVPAAPVHAAPQTATASAACGPVPSHLKDVKFGNVIHVLAKDCGGTFTFDEQLFVGGIIGHLGENCGFPSDLDSRLMLLTFRMSMASVTTMGRQYGTGTIGEGWESQFASAAATIAGGHFAAGLKCSDQARRLADDIVRYLRRTGATSKFVPGCVKHYGSRASAEQCQCLGDVGRAVFPDIHQQEFSSEYYRRIVPMNPFVALQIMIQCRLVDY